MVDLDLHFFDICPVTPADRPPPRRSGAVSTIAGLDGLPFDALLRSASHLVTRIGCNRQTKAWGQPDEGRCFLCY